MISTKGRYALRMMIDIAAYSNGNPVSLKDVSQRQDISIKYLEQVVSLLVKRGFLISIRGNNGGYKLSKKPEEYKVGDILRAAEGDLKPIECLGSDCSKKGACMTFPFWKGLDKAIESYVDSKTLQDLLK